MRSESAASETGGAVSARSAAGADHAAGAVGSGIATGAGGVPGTGNAAGTAKAAGSTSLEDDRPQRVSFTPAVPDGPDCPWTRGRRTRWWLVLPADLLAVALIALLSAAGERDTSLVPELLRDGVVSLIVGWVVAWLVTRPADHLETASRDGGIVMGVTWLAWLVLRLLGGADGVAGFALMLACFLLICLGGWRWLYGFAKAQESLTPKAIQRRLDAQEKAAAAESERSDEKARTQD